MSIKWTGSQGQLERLHRRQSRQQAENQLEEQLQQLLEGSEPHKVRWYGFGAWFRAWLRGLWAGAKFGLACFAGICLIAVAGVSVVDGYQWYESNQPVDHDTPVWIQGDWLAGEYRICQMRTKKQPSGPDSLTKLPRLFCGQDASGFVDFQLETNSIRQNALLPTGDVTADVFDSFFHVLPVRYFGFIQPSANSEDFIYDYDRTDKFAISWRCQRLSESLECKALD